MSTMVLQEQKISDCFLRAFVLIFVTDDNFLNKIFILEILHLQKHCEDSTESSHMPHTKLPLLLTSYICMVHLSQLVNNDRLLTKVHTLFRFPSFLPTILFLFQDLIQDSTLHVVIMSSQAPLDYDSFSDFPCF